MSIEIDALLLALPIRPENLGRLTQIRREVAALAKDRDDWKREWDLFRGSWLRNLGGTVFNKRHLIDALAMTTEHHRVGFERAKGAGLIGSRFYRDDPEPRPKPPVARPLVEYHEDMGPVLWWRFPVEEAPWCGAPDDSDWPFEDAAVHFTPLPAVPVLA